jgi:hypothetical protein
MLREDRAYPENLLADFRQHLRVVSQFEICGGIVDFNAIDASNRNLTPIVKPYLAGRHCVAVRSGAVWRVGAHQRGDHCMARIPIIEREPPCHAVLLGSCRLASSVSRPAPGPVGCHRPTKLLLSGSPRQRRPRMTPTRRFHSPDNSGTASTSLTS